MTPERWQQINQLYHAALELDANRQATFLNQACAGDAGLRDEVESLIASHDQAGSFIAEPALKVAARVFAEEQATSLVGRRFSHYRIESLLGVGGMGEVYLAAHDQQLIWLRGEWEFDPLHSDPRFEDLVQRIGLTQ